MKNNREYRNMPLMTIGSEGRKRFESDYYVEGHACTFDEPYLLCEIDGRKYYEVIDRNAFDGCDMSDVIFQFDHCGRVYARNRMAGGKSPTMIVEPDSKGLFTAADLGSTSESRKMYEDIAAGLIHQMSFGFAVAKDEITVNYEERIITRRIMKFRKLYDTSAVSLPANPSTDISARSASWIDGVIEDMAREETAQRKQKATRTRLLIDMMEVLKS